MFAMQPIRIEILPLNLLQTQSHLQDQILKILLYLLTITIEIDIELMQSKYL